MGFLDKAKQAANDLAAKADTALAGSGLAGPGHSAEPQPEKCFRDLGVLAYLEATGRPADPAERERLIRALREAESRGPLSLHLQTAAPGPGMVPPPPGGAGAGFPPPAAQGAPPPPPGAGATSPPPSPGAAAPDPPASAPAPGAPVPPTAPPPPPPSWAAPDDDK